jgi:hypothetical protein
MKNLIPNQNDQTTRRLQLENEELRRIIERDKKSAVFSKEDAQDAIGEILEDSDTIAFTYDDDAPSISAEVIDHSIDFDKIIEIDSKRYLGRDSSGTGNVEELTIEEVLDFAGKTALTPLIGTEEVLINDGGTLKKTTTQDIADLGGGGTFTRSIVSKTTASLANLAEETGTITIGKASQIFLVVADKECRVRLYSTSALRSADSSRTLGTAITEGDSEPALESVPVVGSLSVPQEPVPTVTNLDTTPSSTIYYAIQNRSGATDTVSVDFTVLILEA